LSSKNYPKAKEMFNLLVNDLEVRADWDLSNFIAVKKLKYNDHGEIIGGPLEELISLKATVTPSEVDYDKRIVRSITLKGRNFVTF